MSKGVISFVCQKSIFISMQKTLAIKDRLEIQKSGNYCSEINEGGNVGTI